MPCAWNHSKLLLTWTRYMLHLSREALQNASAEVCCSTIYSAFNACFTLKWIPKCENALHHTSDYHEDVVVQASSFQCWKIIHGKWSWKCPGWMKCEARLIREGRNWSLLLWAAFPLVRCRQYRLSKVGRVKVVSLVCCYKCGGKLPRFASTCWTMLVTKGLHLSSVTQAVKQSNNIEFSETFMIPNHLGFSWLTTWILFPFEWGHAVWIDILLGPSGRGLVSRDCFWNLLQGGLIRTINRPVGFWFLPTEISFCNFPCWQLAARAEKKSNQRTSPGLSFGVFDEAHNLCSFKIGSGPCVLRKIEEHRPHVDHFSRAHWRVPSPDSSWEAAEPGCARKVFPASDLNATRNSPVALIVLENSLIFEVFQA